MAKSDAPIIVVKRVKKGGHGHHGGAWKIAYADFVTAMMAFFLLMWVLGSTTAGDLAGISSYFQNPMRVSMSGGQGSGETTRIIKGGGDNISKVSGVEAKADADTEQRRVSDSSVTDVENARKDRTKNEAVKSEIEKNVEADAELKNIKGQLFMDITSEGLRIQVVDEKGKPLFNSGGVVPSVAARRLLRVIGKSLNDNTGKIRIEGHTDTSKYANGEAGYTNWELSSERANVARREMIAGGLAPSNVAQVIGFADTIPLNPTDLNDPLNRRISITLLNKKPKKEEKPIQRPIEREAEVIPKGAQDIPSNLRAPAQFLSKDKPVAPAMDISKPDKPATGKPER
ncbi:flagellar motor protein MotB [Polynucleobacter sp. MG-6-Vaara-E2]|jgi:chemotaxis protein MotB|uniref:flagellar motor protein MotB n=1 Tax=Polynucleobacter sp. MG-6-Vaara-E2 TaxID=2576932 RepID=UPI001BFDB6D9|nr:flagellar motor protein MotB [Polynucleobacter sp. MG-6-Vaara-E2]QWD96007.1 flagellar motor protein MotB [Polynucleobacter sp. MG-6-Vaara-E2]